MSRFHQSQKQNKHFVKKGEIHIGATNMRHNHPKKQKPNAKCACGSGKKFKKCCKNGDIRVYDNGSPKRIKVSIQDHMTDFKWWCFKEAGKYMDYDFNPATNNDIVDNVLQHHKMIEEYKCKSFVASHPQFINDEDLGAFINARSDVPGGKGRDAGIECLTNITDGWFSLCFQNTFAYMMREREAGRKGTPLIGWLITGFPTGVKYSCELKGLGDGGESVDGSFSAEIHLCYKADNGSVIDPTQDYNPTIDYKVFVPDPQLQNILDMNRCYDDFALYMNIISNIIRFTPGGTGFLHKNNFKDWKCPMIMMGDWN